MATGKDPEAAPFDWASLSHEELRSAVRELEGTPSLQDIRLIMGNPFLDERIVEELLSRPGLRSSYELRRLVVASPHTPPVRALQLVPTLYWRDLAEIARNTRLRPPVRRSAERHIVERLSGLALGEKVALARRATGLVLMQLRHDPQPRVFAALLENPRITEGLLLPVAASDGTSPAVLRTLAESPSWGSRYPVRVALSRNPRTPVEISLRLLSGLKRADRRAVASHPRLAPALRRRARTLLGEGGV